MKLLEFSPADSFKVVSEYVEKNGKLFKNAKILSADLIKNETKFNESITSLRSGTGLYVVEVKNLLNNVPAAKKAQPTNDD